LLLGCYPLQVGQAYLSNRPVEDYRLSDLRQLFAYVPQDAYLYSGTILDNLRYGNPGASLEEVTTAAKAAYAHDFIMEFPTGYLTPVGERGAHLSGGQRQRIAIARALATNPRILIFDEATSALDYESERIVQENMRAIVRGRTVIIIAHRLAAVRPCTRIVGMHRGEIVEVGTHEQLLARDGGLYAHLWALQSYQARASA
jgi:subfamily B ATP-binding cassette protein HlyB/CyaB